jgi:hypothetical protein
MSPVNVIQLVIDKFQNHKSVVNICAETKYMINQAHEYGLRMEECSGIPQEYQTSMCEAIDSFTDDLYSSISESLIDFDNVTKIIMDDDFMEQANSCDVSRRYLGKFLLCFPNLERLH